VIVRCLDEVALSRAARLRWGSLPRSGSGSSPQDYAPTKYEATNRRRQRNRFVAGVGRVTHRTRAVHARIMGSGRAHGHMVLAMAIIMVGARRSS
jgi:hypothetical protein